MKYITLALMSLLPASAFAQGPIGPIGETLVQVNTIIEDLIPLLMSAAVLMFFWGIVKFIANIGNEEARKAGKALMVWGMIALFVMVSFWGIIGYFAESLGIGNTELKTAPPPTFVNPVPTIVP